MIEINQIYKCNVCGNIVEIVHVGGGALVCCGQPMELQGEKIQDEGQEKHVPIIEKMAGNVCQGSDGVSIKVGSVPHPMEDEHYIEWVEVKTSDGRVGKRFLKPGDKPEAEFNARVDILGARAYCNIHGLWKSTTGRSESPSM